MKREFRDLRLNQIDPSLAPFAGTRYVNRPQRDRFRAVREALGITTRDVSRKRRRTPQTAASFEKSEVMSAVSVFTMNWC
jgi:hypothetical protein